MFCKAAQVKISALRGPPQLLLPSPALSFFFFSPMYSCLQPNHKYSKISIPLYLIICCLLSLESPLPTFCSCLTSPWHPSRKALDCTPHSGLGVIPLCCRSSTGVILLALSKLYYPASTRTGPHFCVFASKAKLIQTNWPSANLFINEQIGEWAEYNFTGTDVPSISWDLISPGNPIFPTKIALAYLLWYTLSPQNSST